jgi:hypothetical protein
MKVTLTLLAVSMFALSDQVDGTMSHLDCLFFSKWAPFPNEWRQARCQDRIIEDYSSRDNWAKMIVHAQINRPLTYAQFHLNC